MMPRWFEAERAFIEACRAGAHHLRAVDAVDEKTCTKCKVSKPRELFYRWAKSPDGRNYRCKACMQADQKQRRKTKTPPVAASGVSSFP